MHSDPIFRYRNTAKAMRDIRARTVDPGIRRLLDDVAADYETVAEVLCRIEQTQRVIAKRQPLVFLGDVGSSASHETPGGVSVLIAKSGLPLNSRDS